MYYILLARTTVSVLLFKHRFRVATFLSNCLNACMPVFRNCQQSISLSTILGFYVPRCRTCSLNKFKLSRTKSYAKNILRLTARPVRRACQVNFGSWLMDVTLTNCTMRDSIPPWQRLWWHCTGADLSKSATELTGALRALFAVL